MSNLTGIALKGEEQEDLNSSLVLRASRPMN